MATYALRTTTSTCRMTWRMDLLELLLNAPQNTTPFRVAMVVPVNGARLIRILISPEGEQPFHSTGQTRRAMVFRIHPELGGIVGVIASLIGLQPKDVTVWVLEGDEP